MKYTKEELEDLIITKGLSYEEIGRQYSVTGSAIRKAASRFGIVLPKRRTINSSETFNKGKGKSTFICLNCGKECSKYPSTTAKFCSSKCQHEYQYKQYIQRWLNGEESGTVNNFSTSKCVRRYLFEVNNNACQVCGCDDINEFSGKSILQIHHIDGNPTNNRPENLMLLCPNCHAKTENYGNRNKNSFHARSVYFGRAKDTK
jgi:hypothetical protein